MADDLVLTLTKAELGPRDRARALLLAIFPPGCTERRKASDVIAIARWLGISYSTLRRARLDFGRFDIRLVATPLPDDAEPATAATVDAEPEWSPL